jgi:hypothetical protein
LESSGAVGLALEDNVQRGYNRKLVGLYEKFLTDIRSDLIAQGGSIPEDSDDTEVTDDSDDDSDDSDDNESDSDNA